MKKFKTTLALLMALGLCVGSVPANTTYTKAAVKTSIVKAVSVNDNDDYEDDYDYDAEDEDYEEEDEVEAVTLSVEDVKVSPSKKTIKIGKSFYINVVADSEELEELPDEEFDEILEESLESITYKSSKSSVARVTKNGKIIGVKKGSAVISTTIATTDGRTKTFKTKVYVTK